MPYTQKLRTQEQDQNSQLKQSKTTYLTNMKSVYWHLSPFLGFLAGEETLKKKKKSPLNRCPKTLLLLEISNQEELKH